MCRRIEHYRIQRFRGYEFVPPEVYAALGERVFQYIIDVRTQVTADQLRKFFGVPVLINDWWWKKRQGISRRRWKTMRGYRPPRSRTGARYSQHRFGRAFDCTIVGVSATQARDVIINHASKFPYITRIEDNVEWLHVDCANVFHRGIYLFNGPS